MDYDMALLINQGPRYGCKRRGARREWITWQHRDVRLVVLVFRQTARRPDTWPERTKGRVPKRQWPMTNNEWPEHSMCGVLMAASNPTFFLKEVKHVISWRSYGILWCSLIEQLSKIENIKLITWVSIPIHHWQLVWFRVHLLSEHWLLMIWYMNIKLLICILVWWSTCNFKLIHPLKVHRNVMHFFSRI